MKNDDQVDRHNLSRSEIIENMPLACCDELAAVEFFEAQRWGASPVCVHRASASVYKMTDAKTGKRSKRFLSRCRDCEKQYTVRIGTVYEETRLDLRHWCYAFWRAAISKQGVAALELMRYCQISYKSALFLMSRIRFAVAPAPSAPKLTGIVECDQTFTRGRSRPGDGKIHKRGRGINKHRVFAAVERHGKNTGLASELLDRIRRRMVTTDRSLSHI